MAKKVKIHGFCSGGVDMLTKDKGRIERYGIAGSNGQDESAYPRWAGQVWGPNEFK